MNTDQRNRVLVGSTEVHGCDIDAQTRCRHYHDAWDIVAMRFKCCDAWYACRQCHDTLTRHNALRWRRDEHHLLAILCGNCGHRLTIRAYLSCDHVCPRCHAAFNPGCAHHRSLYFMP